VTLPCPDPGRSQAARDERGQITAMLVIFSVCLLLAIVAVTDLSASYLRRQAVTSLADGAALAASNGAAAGIYGRSSDDFVVIGQPAAAAAVDSYLRDTGAYAKYPGLQVEVAAQGHTVTVYLSMPYRLPVPVPGVASTTTLHSSGASELPIY
jgi:Flp pilus assembly protein TadG